MTALIRRFVLSGSLLLLGTAAFAQLLPTPESTQVDLFGEALLNTESELAGRGVVLDDAQARSKTPSLSGRPAMVSSPCGGSPAEILWREVRRATDPGGGTHVFYRQHVVGGGLDAELVGSEIAVHRMPDGRLLGIAGRQFESVAISGCPAINAVKAAEEARERVLLHKGHAPLLESSEMSALRASRLAETKIKLVQIDGTFRPAWFTIGDDAEGEPYKVVIDAENERLLAMHGANPGGNCAPTEPLNLVTAYGIPVRPELTSWRTMKANVASRPGYEGFTHEAVWIPSNMTIRHVAFHKTDSSSSYTCSGTGYTVFPLKINTSLSCCSPVYDDWPLIPGYTPLYGRAVGDALWNTYQTMTAFKAQGWNGWDNLNSDARVIVEAGARDQGQFMETASYTAPAGSVRIGPAFRMYSLAASLDLVAHEWGHGVINKTAGFNYSDPVGAQLHEGFADVIGMFVEKHRQASGTGLEQDSDWKMHEDSAVNGTYARGAIDDDADGVPGHDWVGPNSDFIHFDDRLHRQDTLYNTSHTHATGNMLSVAYFIMAAGGSTDLPSGLNPICARPNAASLYAGCTSSNAITFNERLGPDKAGALLFYAITNTLSSSTTWNDVADRVNLAAFMKYNQCQFGPQYNAAGEQNAVRKAFAGIGYPRTQPDIQCP